MITINRIGGDPLGVSQYELVLYGATISASFDHNCPDDLPTLLRKAADQVTIERENFGTAVYNTKSSAKEYKPPTTQHLLAGITALSAKIATRNDTTSNINEKLTLNSVLTELDQLTAKYEST